MYGFLSAFPPFSFTVNGPVEIHKRLREFEEREISRQSCRVTVNSREEKFMFGFQNSDSGFNPHSNLRAADEEFNKVSENKVALA